MFPYSYNFRTGSSSEQACLSSGEFNIFWSSGLYVGNFISKSSGEYIPANNGFYLYPTRSLVVGDKNKVMEVINGEIINIFYCPETFNTNFYKTLYVKTEDASKVLSINISSGRNISGILNLEPFINLRTGIFTNQSFSYVVGYDNKTNIEYLSFFNANTTPFLGITGKIETLSNKPNLNTFEIRKNNITGLIPEISGLNKLILFDVARNKLTGPFPILPNTGTLSYVYLDNNQLTGFIPTFPSNVNLSFLHFQVNNFSGSLPSLQQHSRITQFYCSENKFTGQFPVISNRSLISRIFAHQNFLTGNIPLFSNVNTNLELLTLYNNNLTGADCLTNVFAGNIRTGFIPSRLTTFNVSNNFLPRNIIDGLLISFSGMVNSNNTLGGNLNLAGTNASASSTGISARNYLISKNWTVNVNI